MNITKDISQKVQKHNKRKSVSEHVIYCFSLFDTGYSSPHSLIRELFNSPKNICPSWSHGDLLYVLSEAPPVKQLHYEHRGIAPVHQNTKTVELETHVSFSNRHRENIVPKKIYPPEALKKFCGLSGLETNKVECDFLGPHSEKKFNIHNAFRIYGIFNILNHEKFRQVLLNGVGSRKSYGYGLILNQ